MAELWKRLNEKQQKMLKWLALIALLGLGVLILQPPNQTTMTPKALIPEEAVRPDQAKQWQNELTVLVNNLVGGKGSQVFLTLERGPKLVIAHNSTVDERRNGDGSFELREQTTPMILRSDAERREVPLVLEELEATVRGVVVIVDQTPQPQLRLEIARAVATVLQIPMYRIEVLFKQ